MPRKFLYTLFFVLLACVCACTVRPKHILSNSEMRAILVDLHKADGVIDVADYSYNDTEKQDFCYQYVLLKHDITQATFDSSLVWYTNNPSMFERIYERVYSQLEEEKNIISALRVQNSEQLASVKPTLSFLDSTIVSQYPYKAQYPYNNFVKALLDTCVLLTPVEEVLFYIFPVGFSDSTFIIPPDSVAAAKKITFTQPEKLIKPSIKGLKKMRVNNDELQMQQRQILK